MDRDIRSFYWSVGVYFWVVLFVFWSWPKYISFTLREFTWIHGKSEGTKNWRTGAGWGPRCLWWHVIQVSFRPLVLEKTLEFFHKLQPISTFFFNFIDEALLRGKVFSPFYITHTQASSLIMLVIKIFLIMIHGGIDCRMEKIIFQSFIRLELSEDK